MNPTSRPFLRQLGAIFSGSRAAGTMTGAGYLLVLLVAILAPGCRVPVPSTSSPADNNPVGGQSNVSLTVKAPEGRPAVNAIPVLQLRASVTNHDPANLTARWHVTVANVGNADARALLLTCDLPRWYEYMSSSGGHCVSRRVTWNLGTLAPGSEAEAWVKVRVAAGLEGKARFRASAVSARPVETELGPQPCPPSPVSGDPSSEE